MNGGPGSIRADERQSSNCFSAAPPVVSATGPRTSLLWLRRLPIIFGIFYPLFVYYGLSHWPTRPVALTSTLLFIALIASRKHTSYGALIAPATLVVIAGSAFVLDSHGLMLALPVAINLILLTVFSRSLYWGTPIIERFARMQFSNPSRERLRYCRQVTVVWCIFFAGNACTAGALAAFAPSSWWALYTGLIAYVLVGVLFAAEYCVRTYRFWNHAS